MKKMKVNPGVCGLECTITAEKKGRKDVSVSVETKCGAVKKMMEALEQPLDGYAVCFGKPGQGPVYEAAENLAHAACPIPSALTKCIEAECGLALPRPVSFEFTEE
ncbi:MAG: hypothetical protein IJM49_00070 [Firmicutes bacterium]|nr:hypothetical protein [Bacillota bacterium]